MSNPGHCSRPSLPTSSPTVHGFAFLPGHETVLVSGTPVNRNTDCLIAFDGGRAIDFAREPARHPAERLPPTNLRADAYESLGSVGMLTVSADGQLFAFSHNNAKVVLARMADFRIPRRRRTGRTRSTSFRPMAECLRKEVE